MENYTILLSNYLLNSTVNHNLESNPGLKITLKRLSSEMEVRKRGSSANYTWLLEFAWYLRADYVLAKHTPRHNNE